MRKTFNIQAMIDMVNTENALSDDEFVEYCRGQNALLEQMLHSTGTYEGFRYLEARDMHGAATTVGVKEQLPDGSWNFEDTDRTRVMYR